MSDDLLEDGALPLLLGAFSASMLGIGGFLLGSIISLLAVVIYTTMAGEPSPLVQIALSLTFIQGGFVGITLLYASVRRALREDTAESPAPASVDDSEDATWDSGSDQSDWEADSYDWNSPGETADPDSEREREHGPTAHDSERERGPTAPHSASGDASRTEASRGTPAPGENRGGIVSRLTDQLPISSRREQAGENGGGFHIPVSIPNRRDLVIVGVGYVVAWIGALTMGVITNAISQETGSEQGQNAATQAGFENPEVFFLLLPAMLLIVGPSEELLYRGVVQGRLREVIHPYAAIVIAAIIFGSIHWFALSGGDPLGNLLVLPVLMTTGAVLGATYEFSDNIVVPSLIHGLYNATIVLVLMAALYSGAAPEETAALVWLSPV
jgi:membrane protease YdiL (CAAX protease family)